MIFLGIALATVATLVIGIVYYSVVPATSSHDDEHEHSHPPFALTILVELARGAVLAGVVAGLMTAAGWHGPITGLLLGLALAAFPAVLLTGSMYHEGTSLRAAVTHFGDWLLKLLAIGAIVGAFA